MYARAIYDFTARNRQELTITKGDVLQVRRHTCCGGSQARCCLHAFLPRLSVLVISQVMKMSNNWWLIRNNRGEEGNVPRNVVELTRGSSPLEDQQVSPATLCRSAE